MCLLIDNDFGAKLILRKIGEHLVFISRYVFFWRESDNRAKSAGILCL